jgi:hypothetical protein
VVAFAACSSGQGDLPDLSGTWVSDGYYCPALVRHTETFRITQSGEHIAAVKTVGDKCVPAGHETFSGTMHGREGQVDIWLGAPGGTPAIALRNQKLTVSAPDRFTVSFNGSPVTFRRAQAAATTSAVPWWSLLAAGAVLLAGVLLLLRRGRRDGRKERAVAARR